MNNFPCKILQQISLNNGEIDRILAQLILTGAAAENKKPINYPIYRLKLKS